MSSEQIMIAALLAIFGAALAFISKVLHDKSATIKTQGDEITTLKATSVNDDRVRSIVKEELSLPLDMLNEIRHTNRKIEVYIAEETGYKKARRENNLE